MLKWIYNLGVQHERSRIKRMLAEFQVTYQRELAEFERYRMDEPKKVELTKRIERMERLDEARRMVEDLLAPVFKQEFSVPKIDD